MVQTGNLNLITCEDIMAQKRKPKQGYVYLLKDTNNDTIYKFGCTTLTPEKRCKRVNVEHKKYGYFFKVIASFKSFDIYQDENIVRAKILCAGIGCLSEVFSTDFDDDLNCESDVVYRFLKVGGVLV